MRVAVLAGVACALALAGCGPSAAQVREAREARYSGDRAEVFRLVDDPDAPGWVQERVDELQISIHRHLREHLAAAPGAAASTSPN